MRRYLHSICLNFLIQAMFRNSSPSLTHFKFKDSGSTKGRQSIGIKAKQIYCRPNEPQFPAPEEAENISKPLTLEINKDFQVLIEM